MGVLATYTAYILIQFYRRYPSIRDIVDVARIMGGKPLEILVGVAHVCFRDAVCGFQLKNLLGPQSLSHLRLSQCHAFDRSQHND